MDTAVCTVVTGGGRGIGRAVALRLARETGLILVGRTEADLRSTCDEINLSGGIAFPVAGDVTDYRTAEKTVWLAGRLEWRIKNLICNAGVGKGGPTHEFDLELWREIMDVNVHGAFAFVRACLPQMLAARDGVICFMSSTAGYKGYRETAAYCASKHALVGFARALAKEYGQDGIVAVPLCPGYVEGEMTDRTISKVMAARGLNKYWATDRIAKTNPQRRLIPAEEVAEAVAMICSGKINAVSGEPFMMSGGE